MLKGLRQASLQGLRVTVTARVTIAVRVAIATTVAKKGHH